MFSKNGKGPATKRSNDLGPRVWGLASAVCWLGAEFLQSRAWGTNPYLLLSRHVRVQYTKIGYVASLVLVVGIAISHLRAWHTLDPQGNNCEAYKSNISLEYRYLCTLTKGALCNPNEGRSP